MTTQASERELLIRWRRDGDRAARDELVRMHLPLARTLARRHSRYNEPFDDLEQVAALGLVKAIDRFDLARDSALRHYATPVIVGELQRYYRDRVWSMHFPRSLQETVLATARAT